MSQTYDRSAKHYDRLLAPLERRYLRQIRAEMFALIPDSSTILEVGAGTGANFDFYPTPGHAIASEPSFKMLEIASHKSKSIDLIQADAQCLPLPASSLDAVFATLVFCTVPSLPTAFAEIIRVLRPGGRLVLLEHVRPTGLLGYAFDLLNIFTVALFDDHFNRQPANDAKTAGLKIIEVRRKAFGILNLIVCEKKQ